MRHLSLSQAWEEAKAIITREGRLFGSVALALVVLPQVILAVVGLPVGPQATSISEIIYIAAVLFGFVAQIAINRLAIGPSVTVRDAIALGFVRLVSVFAVMVVLALAMVLITIVFALILSAAGAMTLPNSGQPPSPSLVALLVVLTALIFAILQLVFPIS